MSEQLKLINLDAPWRRFLLLIPAAAVLALVWQVGRWCVGGTVAEFPPDAATVREAVTLAPDDPQVHFTLAVFAKQSFAPDQLDEALKNYEAAVSRSPHDYRLWMELGRARGQFGEAAAGEHALRRAVALAPHYAMPRWYLGNHLLRAGRQGEAFDELRRAAASDPTLRTQIATLLWSFYGGDVEQVAAAVGDSAPARAQLVEYLAFQKRLDEALRMWSSLNAGEKRAQAASGEKLMKALSDAGRYRAALEVYRATAAEGTPAVETGRLGNGDFESVIAAAGKIPYGWQVSSVPQAQVVLDPRIAHGGGRSLRVVFNAPSRLDFTGPAQFVPVEPGARYRLEFYARTEDLKSVNTLVVQVAAGVIASPVVLATSEQLPNGTKDWWPTALDFTVPAGTEGVSVRVVRPPCADETCPIFGRVWYDDFNLQRVGGDARRQQRQPEGARGGEATAPSPAAADRQR